MDDDFLSSSCAFLTAFAYFLLYFIHILSMKTTTVTRYTVPSYIACSPVLRATQRCHLFKARRTICSTLSRSFSIISSQRTYSVCRITHLILDTQQHLRHQCLPPRKHSTVTFEV